MVIEGQHLVENGLLYVAYPKKGNKIYPTFVHRDEIFPTLQVNEADGYIKGSTLKFNRMVSLDETFTVVGMKNVLKKQRRIRPVLLLGIMFNIYQKLKRWYKQNQLLQRHSLH